MRALVTGGAGFIGSNLVRELVKQGWNVDVVDDLSSGSLDLLSGVRHIVFNQSISSRYLKFSAIDDKIVTVFVTKFDNDKILRRIKTSSYDVVFHLAAMPRVSFSVDEPSMTTKNNIDATIRLFEACRHSVNRVIFSSSSSVYGGADNLPTKETEKLAPKSPYALQKKVCEDFSVMFKEFYNLDIINLRYFNVFGPGQYGNSAYSTAVSAWCYAIKNNLPLRSDGDGEQTRDMCYVDNVVSANIKAATCKLTDEMAGRAYNVACGDKVSNREILNYLLEKYPDLKIVNSPTRVGDVKHTLADISRAKNELGYEPSVRFWEGLTRTMKWWEI